MWHPHFPLKEYRISWLIGLTDCLTDWVLHFRVYSCICFEFFPAFVLLHISKSWWPFQQSQLTGTNWSSWLKSLRRLGRWPQLILSLRRATRPEWPTASPPHPAASLEPWPHPLTKLILTTAFPALAKQQTLETPSTCLPLKTLDQKRWLCRPSDDYRCW